ncbi:putative tyrosine protein phosphatase OCA1 SCDLUD_002912 [Saccharomycodes ludwigii]|uniref:putative tyrosine protein phosphatase OCA1 n=1 Tax=Saccharomycodes ludwigii TaxID=36035 RepID=UPI001E82FCF2|nr:hypothetical protein SCDLUD_002912 [Saccharomycodes ludwigii]KAH3901420.1 hypothetical protein SCDLUD_002912 [Saccharomycodes ludwigii]
MTTNDNSVSSINIEKGYEEDEDNYVLDEEVEDNTNKYTNNNNIYININGKNNSNDANNILCKNTVVPPLNFCPVERYLYRSGQPSPVNFPFLDTLNLKTIIWLSNEDPQDALLDFCELSRIELQFAAISPEGGEDDNPWDGLTEHSIINALETIVQKKNYPLLVCCGMGRHRTGTVIGCLRRIMKWNLASCSEEYRRFTGSRGGRILVELLIEAFNTDLVEINENEAPDWLLNAVNGGKDKA